MSGPERIWAFYSDIFGAMWTGVKDEGATEYIRADLADPAAIREAAIREAADVARYYAEADYCAMGYPEDGGIAASGTANIIERDILALIDKEN